ncbi:MAG: ABC transporter substrate-binding protein [Gammaproteobacteria bacterium]
MNLKHLTFCLVAATALRMPAAQAVEVTIACDSDNGRALCQEGADIWAKKTGNTVKTIPLPPGSERLGIYQQFLAAQSTVVDIYTIDVVWTGVLANYLVDMREQAAAVLPDHFPAIVKNNTVDGRLVAMPWYGDTGLLFYRKDLLQKYGEKPPQTWEELEESARRIQAAARRDDPASKLWGYVWQGAASETLTCDALEWVASYGGGTLVDRDGKVDIDNPRAIKALQRAHGWVGTISPPEVVTFDEEKARAVFQVGQAVYMRNWPYAWGHANAQDSVIKGKVGVMALPKGGADGIPAATLGGQLLAVSRYSRHSKEAVDLVMYLTSRQEQRRRAILGGFNPTITALYKDQEVIAANPYQADLYGTLAHATARPSAQTKARYTQASSEFWNAAHSVLTGQSDAATAVKTLDTRLRALTRNGNW